ncbi:d2113a0d-feb3-45cf-8d62-6f36a3d840cc [Sclerotinia trifoliorum]|uniref:D2113a0d-feb3-45cf-8d62-6f36a3d840cc n=1 Tax=Sclerotinia trifoliorum TaxID=28548 RepID=A0A8H2VZI9_9HELO|nr:d2113a0d-feb3-45cf-8d62-6f36a3d840cc [Sclerotinia trifoliorum]
MEDENGASNVQLPSSEHEDLIEERSNEKFPIIEVCEISAPNTSGNVTPEIVTAEEDSSDVDMCSDENSLSNETRDIEVTQHNPGDDTAENASQEKELPNAPDLDLQFSTTDISELEISEPEPSEPEFPETKPLQIEVTQLSENLRETIEIEVSQLLSPSPEPIEIDIPEQSDSSPELSEPPNQGLQDHSGSDADNECSDGETTRVLGDWQLRQLAENALEIAIDVSTPKPSAPSLGDPNICKPRTPLPERVWHPSSSDPTRPNKPKCPPCERKKKRFDCLGSPPCNECSKRNMTAEQCASFALVRRRGKRRLQDDEGMVTQKAGKRGKRR